MGSITMRSPMRRVNVVGTSASGKSSLALALAARLGVPYVELDALHWEPNWREAPNEVMRERVAAAIAAEAWVVDGNYAAVRDLVWASVDTVVWLDLPRLTVMWLIERYSTAMGDPTWRHMNFVRMRSNAEANRWLRSVGRQPG